MLYKTYFHIIGIEFIWIHNKSIALWWNNNSHFISPIIISLQLSKQWLLFITIKLNHFNFISLLFIVITIIGSYEFIENSSVFSINFNSLNAIFIRNYNFCINENQFIWNIFIVMEIILVFSLFQGWIWLNHKTIDTDFCVEIIFYENRSSVEVNNNTIFCFLYIVWRKRKTIDKLNLCEMKYSWEMWHHFTKEWNIILRYIGIKKILVLQHRKKYFFYASSFCVFCWPHKTKFFHFSYKLTGKHKSITRQSACKKNLLFFQLYNTFHCFACDKINSW